VVSSRSGKGKGKGKGKGRGKGKRDTEGWCGGRGKGGRAAPAAPRWEATAADAKPAAAPMDTSGEWRTVPDRSGGGTPPRGQKGGWQVAGSPPVRLAASNCARPRLFHETQGAPTRVPPCLVHGARGHGYMRWRCARLLPGEPAGLTLRLGELRVRGGGRQPPGRCARRSAVDGERQQSAPCARGGARGRRRRGLRQACPMPMVSCAALAAGRRRALLGDTTCNN
jgi:hypothetical protein